MNNQGNMKIHICVFFDFVYNGGMCRTTGPTSGCGTIISFIEGVEGWSLNSCVQVALEMWTLLLSDVDTPSFRHSFFETWSLIHSDTPFRHEHSFQS